LLDPSGAASRLRRAKTAGGPFFLVISDQLSVISSRG
jgi:hypothetical protein